MIKKYLTPILSNQLKIKTHLIWVYLSLTATFFLGSYLIYSNHSLAILVFELGSQLGKVSLLFYTTTLIPGIARRFRFSHPLISLLTIFRRQLGIFTYLFAFAHFLFVRGIFSLMTLNFFPRSIFELMGIFALFALIPLFLTSNDWAVQKLGKWWKRIHRLTYLALALVFLHVALQKSGTWSLLAGTVITAETLSGLYLFIRKKFASTKNQVQ